MWVKLNLRPEVSPEPTHFLTLMSSGKTFSSLDGTACTYQCSDQFQFLPGHWQAKVFGFLKTLKNPANLYKDNLNNTRNNLKSQFQKKKQKKKNGRIVELLIPTLNKIIRNQDTYFLVIMNNRLKVISWNGASL